MLWLLDVAPSASELEDMQERCNDKSLIIIQNKIDKNAPLKIGASPDSSQDSVKQLQISAKQGQGIDALEQAIYEAAHIPELTESDIIVTSARQYQSLIHAHDNLTRVIAGLETGLSGDLISEDLNLVLDDLSDITGQGRIVPNEVLGNIFKNFCVGK